MQFKDVVVALAIPALSTAAALPQEFHTEASQIVGGSAATTGQFPYIVSLQYQGSHICGGTLINANTVITAAHCMDYAVSGYQIRAGSINRSSGGTVSRVSAKYVNPAYSGNDNDIAVLKLTTSIPTSSTVAYASLPASGSDPAAGSSSTVSGWGTTSSGGSSIPTGLRYVDVPIVSRATCRSQYGSSAITNNMVCAGETQGGQDSCQGDSGGPLVTTGTSTLIGVVSFGNGCALANYAGVYTRVSTQLSFVNQYL